MSKAKIVIIKSSAQKIPDLEKRVKELLEEIEYMRIEKNDLKRCLESKLEEEEERENEGDEEKEDYYYENLSLKAQLRKNNIEPISQTSINISELEKILNPNDFSPMYTEEATIKKLKQKLEEVRQEYQIPIKVEDKSNLQIKLNSISEFIHILVKNIETEKKIDIGEFDKIKLSPEFSEIQKSIEDIEMRIKMIKN